MSTKNLDMTLINRLRTAEDKVVKDIETRAAQVVAESDEVETRRVALRQQLEEDRRRHAIIERLREQRAEDNFSQLDEEHELVMEEASQLDWILNGRRPAPAEPAVQSEDPPAPESTEDPELDEDADEEADERINEEATAPVVVIEPASTQDRPKPQIPWVWVLTILAALITLVVMSRNIDTILGWGAGDENWKDNGFVRFVTLVAPPLLVGYLVWAYTSASDRLNNRDE